MNNKKEKILGLLTNENYVPLKAKEIAVILSVPKSENSEFRKILDELEHECKIRQDAKSRYVLNDQSQYLTGTFRANQRGFGFVKVEGLEEEIYIHESKVKDALDGDEVLIELVERQEGLRQEGHVVKVTKHEKDIVVGIFQKSRNFGFVVPDDKKITTDIFISKSNWGKARNNDKVVVKLTKFPSKGKNAEGKIVEVLGRVDEAGVDMLSLIKEYKLSYEFPKQVIEEARAIGNEIDQKETKSRLDLREKEIFTIDGEDAKDLDDAVCVERTEDGNYILGVHIADVSHYVKENSFLDKEAIIRGTSVYMLDRVIPMLPKELSNGICSLNQKVDRLALSCIMEIDKNGIVISADIRKTVIRVTKRMSYNDVYGIISGDEKLIEENKTYVEHFKLMEELALILKQRRMKAGSLNLDIPESKVILDKNGHAVDIKEYESTFANEIIEQFMLTANESVAEKFYWLEAPFIYRVHEEPDLDKVKELNTFIWNFGYKIKTSQDKVHPIAFSEVLEGVKGKPEERVVSTLILRTLKVARYESENKGHFGIASKYYCHFTSPIRRYPDLYIHRIISEYLAKGYNLPEDEIQRLKANTEKYSTTSSEREKVAQKVERDSIDLKKAEYMQDKIGNEYDGIVSSVTSFGMFVELENTVEGLVRFENMGNEYFEFDDQHKQLIGEHTKTVYKIGTKVKIRVIFADKITRKIDFEIVEQDEEIDENLIE